jgi:hypothetical protein
MRVLAIFSSKKALKRLLFGYLYPNRVALKLFMATSIVRSGNGYWLLLDSEEL